MTQEEKDKLDEKYNEMTAVGGALSAIGGGLYGLGAAANKAQKIAEKKGLEVAKKFNPNDVKILKRSGKIIVPVGGSLLVYSRYKHYKNKKDNNDSKED